MGNLRFIIVCLAFFATNIFGQSKINFNGAVNVNIYGGSELNPVYLVVDNKKDDAIVASPSAKLISEGQFNILRWNISDTVGVYIVPFGNNQGVFRQVVSVNNAGIGAGKIEFSTYPTAQNNVPLPVGVNTLAHVDATIPADGDLVYDRFWITNPVGYSTKPEGNISFEYLASGMTGDLIYGTTPMGAQNYSTNGNAWVVNQLGIDNLNGKLENATFTNTTFSPFWTLVNFGTPLPVNLINFDAVWDDANQRKGKIFWTTASEQNSAYFDLEKSTDGYSWYKMDQLSGTGTTSLTTNYLVYDFSPFNGINYYRLKQVDFNGNYTYSSVKTLKKTDDQFHFFIYPNPVIGNFEIYFEGIESQVVSVCIFDSQGKKIEQKDIDLNVQNHSSISLEHQESGVYYVKVSTNNFTLQQKIVLTN
jgi:hypothetical protein